MSIPVVKPLGLVTTPNAYGQYPPGALRTCSGVYIRNPGLIEPFPNLDTWSGAAATNNFCRALFAASASVLAVYDDLGAAPSMAWITSSSKTAITPQTGFALLPVYPRCLQTRNRFFLTSSKGVLVIDSEGDTTARVAGFAAPTLLEVKSSQEGRAIPLDSCVRWRVVFRRTQLGNGTTQDYVTIGAPSNPAFFDTTTVGFVADVTLTVGWTSTWNYKLEAGDSIDLYRTTAEPSGVDPGDDYFFVNSHVITSSEITARSADIVDATPEAELRASLYTNSDQDGAANPNNPPGFATDIAIYKGYTFYAQTQNPSFVHVTIPNAFGIVTGNALGIGTRYVDATMTLDSPVLTACDDTTGIAPGQRVLLPSGGVAYPGFVANVVSVTSTTITLSANATSSGSHRFYITDVLQISGTTVYMAQPEVVSSYSLTADVYTLIHDIWVRNLNVLVQYNYAQVQELVLGDTGTVSGLDLIFSAPYVSDGTFTIRATNGANYSPALPEIGVTAQTSSYDTRPNRLVWSKESIPEAVSPLDELFVGAGTIIRIISTADCILVFCTDGLYRLSGDAGVWRVDLLNPTLVLAYPNAVVAYGNAVYAYTNRGVVSITSEGTVEDLSAGILSDLIPGAPYTPATWLVSLAVDIMHREIWLRVTGHTYIYNTLTGAWYELGELAGGVVQAMAWYPAASSMLLATFLQTGGQSWQGNTNHYTFKADSTLDRMAGSFTFQPLLSDDNPGTLKQWLDVVTLFDSVTQTFTHATTFTAGASTQAISQSLVAAAQYPDARVVVPVPRNAACAPSLAFGVALSGGGTNSHLWRFRGFVARAIPSADASSR